MGVWPRHLLLLVLYLTLAGFRPVGLTDDGLPATTVTWRAADTLTDPTVPEISARAGILVDDASGQVLWSDHANDRLAMASTTKLMTALLVVESGRYFDQVTIEAGDLVGGSTMGLVGGETLSVRDLLDGLLIPSGNDAATALARHLGTRLPGPGRPVARFVAQMNGRAGELGLQNTSFRNPAGFDDSGHYSTAADLANLARVAVRQPVIAQIVAQSSGSVRGRKQSYGLRSTNLLLQRLPGTLGVKTGTTDAAGECLITLVERSGHRLISVVLGSSDRYGDTMALMSWGFDHYRWLEPPSGLASRFVPTGSLGWLGPGPPLVVPASQVHFVEYRLRGSSETAGEPAIEAFLLGRHLATRTIHYTTPGRVGQPSAD